MSKRIANKSGNGVALAANGVPSLIRSQKKSVSIAGQTFNTDHEALIGMIRQVTQTIGEYTEQSTLYASYMVRSLRKARADMVSDLETHFGIHWRIDEETGKSVFYI